MICICIFKDNDKYIWMQFSQIICIYISICIDDRLMSKSFSRWFVNNIIKQRQRLGDMTFLFCAGPSVMGSMTVLTKRTKIRTTVYSTKRWVFSLILIWLVFIKICLSYIVQHFHTKFRHLVESFLCAFFHLSWYIFKWGWLNFWTK